MSRTKYIWVYVLVLVIYIIRIIFGFPEKNIIFYQVFKDAYTQEFRSLFLINTLTIIIGAIVLLFVTSSSKNTFKYKWILFSVLLIYSLFIPFEHYQSIYKIHTTTDYYGNLMIHNEYNSIAYLATNKMEEMYVHIMHYMIYHGKDAIKDGIARFVDLLN